MQIIMFTKKDKLINKIETAYKESFERNNDILTLLNKLIDNYNGDKTMYNTIVENYKLKIKKCDNESDLASVVSFLMNMKFLDRTDLLISTSSKRLSY